MIVSSLPSLSTRCRRISFFSTTLNPHRHTTLHSQWLHDFYLLSVWRYQRSGHVCGRLHWPLSGLRMRQRRRRWWHYFYFSTRKVKWTIYNLQDHYPQWCHCPRKLLPRSASNCQGGRDHGPPWLLPRCASDCQGKGHQPPQLPLTCTSNCPCVSLCISLMLSTIDVAYVTS